MIHEDERRILEDWPEAKTITVKENCTLGQHYHKIKTERFVLVGGEAVIYIGREEPEDMIIGKLYTVFPGQAHTFHLQKGSVLIGLCSHIFDPTDDYRD